MTLVVQQKTFDFFVARAIKVIMLSQEEARHLNHSFMGTEHLLLGLMATAPSIAADVFKSLGITLTAARTAVEDVFGRGSTNLSIEI